MIVTLSGITGVGKSYYKKYIVQNLNFKNLVIHTTREPRQGEVDGIDKVFVTNQELDDMKKEGKILVDYDLLGIRYGFRAKDVLGDENGITELHYEWIQDFKEKVKNTFAIYMVPTDFERAKKELEKRNLTKEVEQARIEEMKEQIKFYQENKKIQDQFDYIFYNDYTQKSEEEMVRVIREKLEIDKNKN